MRPAQLAKYLHFAFTNNFNTLVTGKPGAAKTSIITQVAAQLNYKLIVSHPVVSDIIDYKGLPFAKDGKAGFLPFGELEQLIEADSPTIFFLDDLGQAAESIQKATMHILLARHVGEHKVSDHVRFVAATNRKQDRAGVTGILSPVLSRFKSVVELDINAEDWRTWAIKADMPSELIAFLMFKPQLLENAETSKEMVNTVSPRTLASVGDLQNAGLPEELEFEAFSGAAGEGFATEYRAFKKLVAELPNVEEIIRNPATAALPKEPATKYALAGALALRMDLQTIKPILQYLDRLSAEISVVTIKIASNKTPAIKETPEFIDWVMKNATLLA